MRCPACGALDDRVVDSRQSDDGTVTRRRRECGGCGHRYTTFERLEGRPAQVVKSDGRLEPFSPEKLAAGVRAAAKGRPISDDDIAHFVSRAEDAARSADASQSTEQIGLDVLGWLAEHDSVAYLRFASVYKGFDDPDDFQREARLLKSRS